MRQGTVSSRKVTVIMRKKTYISAMILSFTIGVFLLLSAFLNTQSFRNSYLETAAKDNAAMARSVVGQLEYTLKYGKTLDNYYGIETVFEDLRQYCDYAEQIYIVNRDGKILYTENGTSYGGSEKIDQYLMEVKETGDSAIWSTDNNQYLLIPIKADPSGEVMAALGIRYKMDSLESRITVYTSRVYRNAIQASGIGILLFLALFFSIRKKQEGKYLKRIIVPAILLANTIFGILSYGVFQNGYREITHNTADVFGTKIIGDIDRVVSQGVPYSDLYEIDLYFKEILGGVGQIDSVRLEIKTEVNNQEDSLTVYALPHDITGQRASLVIMPSKDYIDARLRNLILSLVVSLITSLMIAGEVVAFILTILTQEVKTKNKEILRKQDKNYQPLGIVRGLSFFFGTFRYMSIAFVSIVLVSIYKPVVVFGYELPYDIVMGLPLSIQIFTSIFTAWLSGMLIGHWGWKPVAVTGILIMSAGTATAAVSGEPYLFLLAQVIIGTGLGLASTAFDIYAVFCAPDQEMELYAAHANAGIIVGMSCSSAIGALIAGAFGYSGAYFAMAVIGCVVALLVIVLGLNILEGKSGASPLESKTAREASPQKHSFDTRFCGYLLFMVLPYFFVNMFVDYFFPVYANQQGMSTEMIGYIFMAYGICNSYIGVPVCTALTKRMSCAAIMPVVLGVLGIGLLFFSAGNIFVFSLVLVMLIAICDGVMPSQQFKYVCALPYSKRKGFTKAISIEGVFSSAIRGFAPIIFGYVMMRGTKGLLVVSMLIIVCAALFSLVNKRGERKGGGEHA